MENPVVVTPGTHSVGAGIAGNAEPKFSFRPHLRRKRGRAALPYLRDPDTLTWQDYVVDEPGDEGTGPDRTPFQARNAGQEPQLAAGSICDMDGFECLLYHAFYSYLRRAPEEHALLLSEPCMNDTALRASTLQHCMETFCLPALFLTMDARLSLFAHGLTEGLVCDLGEQQAHAVAFEPGASSESGFSPAGDVGWPELAAPPFDTVNGAMLTEEISLKVESGGRLGEVSARERTELIRLVKETCGAVTRTPSRQTANRSFELPDGSVVELDLEESNSTMTDTLFDPSMLLQDLGEQNLPVLGLVDALELAASSTTDRDDDDRSLSVCLVGGTSQINCLDQRLETSLRERLTRKDVMVVQESVNEHTSRHSTWIGGSIIASLTSMDPCWMSKEDYDEVGPELVNQKWPGGAARFPTGSLTKAASSASSRRG